MRLFALALACLSASPAAAQQDYDTDPPGALEFSGGIEAMTDYRFRGISRSGGDPAGTAWGEVHHVSGVYGGVIVTTLEGPPAFADLEFEPYVGLKGSLAPLIDFDVGLVRRISIGGPDGLASDYWEPHAAIIGVIGPARLRVGAAWAPEQAGLGDRDNLYLSADAELGVPLTPLTLDAHIGHADGALSAPSLLGLGESGTDWAIGARYAFLPTLSGKISYVGNDAPAVDGLTDDTVVASVIFRF